MGESTVADKCFTLSWLSFVGTRKNGKKDSSEYFKACVLEVWDWIYDVDYTNWDPFMWPSYSRRDATLSPYSTDGVVGHCWQIYSQCQCMPCYFIRLIYSTTPVRSGAARSWHWCASTQTPWPESLLHLCLTHPLHFPHWFSHQLCQHMARVCTMVQFTRRVLGDAGGVTLQEYICNLESARFSC